MNRTDGAIATLEHARLLKVAGLGNKRYRMPRQRYPKSIENEYAKALIQHVDHARNVLHVLDHELPGLLERAHEARNHDADESKRAQQLIANAREALKNVTQPTQIDAIAQSFGKRTQQFNRVQLGRQVRAALGADVFAADKRIQTLLDHYVTENAVLIKSIPSQVIDQVEGIVSRAFTSGRMHADIAKEIDERFDVGESRARLIARDQIGKLYGQTNAYRQQDLGITSFIWRTAGDENVRPEHAALDNREFTYNDPPDEGLPGEPIQCRCSAEPVFTSILNAADDE